MLSFENQNIEFKQAYVPDIRKEVMGFANAEGGTVYIGVRKDGAVVGVDDPRRRDAAGREFAERFFVPGCDAVCQGKHGGNGRKAGCRN